MSNGRRRILTAALAALSLLIRRRRCVRRRHCEVGRRSIRRRNRCIRRRRVRRRNCRIAWRCADIRSRRRTGAHLAHRARVAGGHRDLVPLRIHALVIAAVETLLRCVRRGLRVASADRTAGKQTEPGSDARAFAAARGFRRRQRREACRRRRFLRRRRPQLHLALFRSPAPRTGGTTHRRLEIGRSFCDCRALERGLIAELGEANIR